MKQLDVVVSPPAFIRNPYLTLTHVTFDLDPGLLVALSMNFFPSEFFPSELLSSDFWYSHRQTDRRPDRQTESDA